MRSRLNAAILIAAVLSGNAAAQTPTGSPPGFAVDPQLAAPVVSAPVVVAAPVEPPPFEGFKFPALEYTPNVWTADLIVGFPTFLRFQRRLGDGIWSFEGLMGIAFVLPTVGVGLRADLPLWTGEGDAILFRPGVDVYCLFNPFHELQGEEIFGLLGADVDVLWRHRWSERCCGVLGFKVGVAASFVGEGTVLPLVGIIGGLHF